MIKPIEEIPQTMAQKREQYRKMIRADIQEAIDKGIRKFEFVGDAYNYRYLANYAREEAQHITRKTVRPYLVEAKKQYNLDYVPDMFNCKDYIKITSRKGEDRMHVYCEINPDAIPVYVEWAAKEAVERQRRYKEEMERRRKACD